MKKIEADIIDYYKLEGHVERDLAHSLAATIIERKQLTKWRHKKGLEKYFDVVISEEDEKINDVYLDQVTQSAIKPHQMIGGIKVTSPRPCDYYYKPDVAHMNICVDGTAEEQEALLNGLEADAESLTKLALFINGLYKKHSLNICFKSELKNIEEARNEELEAEAFKEWLKSNHKDQLDEGGNTDEKAICQSTHHMLLVEKKKHLKPTIVLDKLCEKQFDTLIKQLTGEAFKQYISYHRQAGNKNSALLASYYQHNGKITMAEHLVKRLLLLLLRDKTVYQRIMLEAKQPDFLDKIPMLEDEHQKYFKTKKKLDSSYKETLSMMLEMKQSYRPI